MSFVKCNQTSLQTFTLHSLHGRGLYCCVPRQTPVLTKRHLTSCFKLSKSTIRNLRKQGTKINEIMTLRMKSLALMQSHPNNETWWGKHHAGREFTDQSTDASSWKNLFKGAQDHRVGWSITFQYNDTNHAVKTE